MFNPVLGDYNKLITTDSESSMNNAVALFRRVGWKCVYGAPFIFLKHYASPDKCLLAIITTNDDHTVRIAIYSHSKSDIEHFTLRAA